MVYFQIKNPNFWVNFGGPLNGKGWYTLQAFGILYGQSVILVAIWCISLRFGKVYQEKSGNPEICNVQSLLFSFSCLLRELGSTLRGSISRPIAPNSAEGGDDTTPPSRAKL
jgi:hypothetical protein